MHVHARSGTVADISGDKAKFRQFDDKPTAFPHKNKDPF
jgi:hypothetical protein